MWDLHDVRRAIDIEQGQALEPLIFRVRNVRKVRGCIRLEVTKKPGRASGVLDENLEEAVAWWPCKNGGSPGTGLVKMANPDDSELIIRPAHASEIEIGADVWVYPIDFLRALKGVWGCDRLAQRALTVARRTSALYGHKPQASTQLPLRDRQQRAVGLIGSQVGLLHGPPGTGKTYTLGVNVAHLIAHTQWKVLITATTNTAVDQALIAADDALARMGRHDLRSTLVRMGSGFDAERFAGRNHLLPSSDGRALEALMFHKALEPDKKDVEHWIAWRDAERALRASLRVDVAAIFGGARVVAATATSVFFNFEAYEEIPWNLLIVDEASQLPAASAVMAATLATRTLFAGDPKQLPAVVQSQHPLCKRYMMQTAFDIFENKAPFVRLNEQSRMSPEICELVSKTFYNGELIVAADKREDRNWLSDRSVDDDMPIQIRNVDAESTWSSKYQGRIRYKSALDCVDEVESLVAKGVEESDIWVLTPFRAQRAFIRNWLYALGRKNVTVSTVHRAQGGERKVVLFDPVDAAGRFLTGELGDRLMNVALSRAMARIIIFLSDGDLSNRRVAQIASLANAIRDPSSRLAEMTLPELVRQFGTKDGGIGKVIRIGPVVGSVEAFEKSGDVIVLRCRDTGMLRRFKTRMDNGARATPGSGPRPVKSPPAEGEGPAAPAV